MKVGMLLWPRAGLDVDASGGMETSTLNALKCLNDSGIESSLFVKSVNRKHPYVKVISHLEFLGSRDYLYYLHFIFRNLRA